MFRISAIALMIGATCVACNHDNDRAPESAPPPEPASMAAASTSGAVPLQTGGMGGMGGTGGTGGTSGIGGIGGTGGIGGMGGSAGSSGFGGSSATGGSAGTGGMRAR